MTAALAVIAGVLTVIVPYTLLLRIEQRRVAELLALLEAKAAPAEYAGYIAQAPSEPGPQFLFSDDGLIGIPLHEASD